MKKLMPTILFISLAFPFTVHAKKSLEDYAWDLRFKCEKTKNRKICHRAIKAVLNTVPRPGRTYKSEYKTGHHTSKKMAYQKILWMLRPSCQSSNWEKEACKLLYYYTDMRYEESFGRKYEYKSILLK